MTRAHIGHARCSRYAMMMVINGTVNDVLDDKELFNEVLVRTARLPFAAQEHAGSGRDGWGSGRD